MKYFALSLLFLFLFACAQEDEKKAEKVEETLKSLPKLAEIQVPEGVEGVYVGMLPCDECDIHRVRMTLDSAGKAAVQEVFISSAGEDTVKSSATYIDSAEFVAVRFDDDRRFFRFQKHKGTSLYYLNRDGNVYLDETEEPYQLLRLLNVGKSP